MKNALKKAISILLVAVMVFGAAPLAGFVGLELPNIFDTKAEVATSGTCGDNLTWEFNQDSGILTINGYGKMSDFSYNSCAPWYGFADVITAIELTNELTSIGDYAFKECENIYSIHIPEYVYYIGDSAFMSCRNLNTVNIPYGTVEIGEYAFAGNENLSELFIPDTVRTIGSRAFSRTNLSELTIPNSVTNLDSEGLFSSCLSLSKVTLPETLTDLRADMFRGCTSLEKIDIPNSVTYIRGDAFRECISLTKINLPDNLLLIGDDAFYGCTGISSISIPKTVKMVDGTAFYKCTNLKNISIPDEVTGLSAGNFLKTAYYDDPDNWDDGALYIGKHLIDIDDEKISPYYHVKNGTKTIAELAFSPVRPQDSKIRSITLPDGLTSIGNRAFQDCQNLTTISIPDSVTDISNNAFANTAYYNNSNNWKNGVLYVDNHLIKVDESFNGDLIVNDGTQSIAYAALMNCNLITSVSIPSSVTNIRDYAFKGCVSLSSVNFAKNSNLNYMGVSAFESCSKLKNFEIPQGVEEICESSFANCKNLQNITIPAELSVIGDFAFWNCLLLEDIVLPSQMSYIGKWAFTNCEKIENITIPSGVLRICESTFNDCINLKNIVIPNTIKSIEFSAFSGCSFDTIIIPESVTKIDSGAFRLCRNLTSIVIPQGVTCISIGTFDRCTSLTSVTLPDGITVIEKDAFIDCCNLKDIYIPGSVSRIEHSAFFGCNNLKKVIIPDSVVVIEECALSSNSYDSIIEYIHIPDSVKIIENQTFKNHKIFICSDTEECYAKQFAEANGIKFKLCDGKHSIEADENTNTLKLIHSSPANKATAVSYDDDLILRFNQNITERFGPESLGYGELAISNYDTDETVFSTYDVFKGYSMSSMPEVQDNCLIIRGAFKRIEPGEKYYVYLSSGVIKAETNSALSFDGFTDKDDYTFSYLSPSDKEGASIDVYSSQPMVNIAPDEEIEIKVVLSYDGKPCKQDGITFSIADGSVAEIAEIVKQSENTRVIIRGKKQGATPLNITATYDNVSCSVPITVTTEKTVYYSTDLEQFYDDNPLFIDGMFIDNFDIVENDDGSAEYNFDVYNADCCIGAVDVYTSSGKRTESVMIDKFDGDYPSNIFEHTETAMKMLWHIGDYLDVNQYKGSTQTEKTSVSVYVPANGYFTITKSILDSDSCAIYNISNLGFEVVSSIAKKLKSKESEITEEMAEKVLSEEQKTYIEFIDKIRQKFLKEEFKLTTEIASGFTDELLENTGKLFVAAGKPIIDCIIDVAKSYFEKGIYDVLFGVTWGGVVKDTLDNFFYTPVKVAKLLSQILLIREYADYSSVYVYQKQNDGERVSNGVKAKSEMLKDNVIFHSVTITSGNEVDYVKSIHNPDVHCDVLDISVVQNGEISDLIYPVTVYIPIPEGWDQEKISVYHVGDDNKHEKLSITVENGYIKFTTDDFSPFIIASGEIDFMDNFTINNLNNSASVNYGDSLLLSTNDLTLPEGAYIKWEVVSGKGVELNQSADGKNCKVTSVSSGTATVKAVVVDRNGVPIKNGLGNEIASEQTITSKAGFFQKIISFFKNLFGMNRTVVQTVFKGIY